MIRRRRLAAGVALAVYALSPQVAEAGKGDPQEHLTAADTRLATSVLLKNSDLGVGWKSSAGASAKTSSCGIVLRLEPVESDLVETGTASGPVYSTKKYEALDQTVSVFATPAQANKAWTRTVKERLVICMEEQVENTSGMGAPVSVTDWSRLKLPRLLPHVAGFRVKASATAGKTKSNVYYDVILLSGSRTLTKIVFSSLQKPFPAGYETRLAGIVATRLNTAQHAP